MPKIRLLESAVADQIAAGEVVERPSSVVKELVENALDAGATSLRVEIEGAGRRLVRVWDDGEGMEAEDLFLCVRRHATSKISEAADLERLGTFGFRGEALPSIGSVSRMRLVSRARGAESAWALEVDGGTVGALKPEGRAQGTTVEVRNLFFNTPARLKFLKSDATENGRVVADLGQMSLPKPGTAFYVTVDGRKSLELPAVQSPLERLHRLWGASLGEAALPLEHSEGELRVTGWVAPPQLSRGNRSGQWLYVNGRVVEHRQLGFHLAQAFGSLLFHGRHPVAAVFVEIPPHLVDVNVHPAKREVRFRQEAQVLDAIRHAVGAALRKAELFATLPEAAPPSRSASIPGGAWNAAASPSRWGAPSAPSPEAVANAASLFQAPLVGERLSSDAVDAAPIGMGARPPQAADLSGTGVDVQRPDWPVPLAQLHRTYILCQDSQGLVIVDQHAAHERVLYERHLKLFAARGVRSQRLLLPQRIQVSAAQEAILAEWLPALSELGLELESVGSGLFFVSALPEFLRHVEAPAFVLELLEPQAVRQPESGDRLEDFRRETAARMACRAAVKAGDELSWEAMGAILKELSRCEIPWSCPHGRPPLIRMPLKDLERFFLRR
jgi:DNA mismatch repair protein MutL